ncbi:MAG TPA: monovalent cation/H(+) antiporter subunit G [Burkholderiales bacterium]|nr:monovalent cation/H(+) antiporter subunit G [Burkholderiales bacterium]
MSHAAEVPAFIAFVTAALVLAGAALALIGSLGLLRLKSFYDRLHAPTLGTTLGTVLIAIASMVLFSTLESRPVIHEVLIGVFMTITTPVTFMLMARAARHRDGSDTRNADDGKP